MKRHALTFGLVGGLLIAILQYTEYLLVYLGIRSYRDTVLGGEISFGRAFACGILISAAALRRRAPSPADSPTDGALA